MKQFLVVLLCVLLGTVTLLPGTEAKKNPIKLKNGQEVDVASVLKSAIQRLSLVNLNVNALGNFTAECAFCSLAVNEVEGLLSENLTITEVEQKIESDFCVDLPSTFQVFCDDFIQDLPALMNYLDQQYTISGVCIELGYCAQPFSPNPDPQPVSKYTINLDVPPSARWNEICSVPQYVSVMHYLYGSLISVLPDGGKDLLMLGDLLNEYYFPTEYAQEIQGCAAAAGIPSGFLTIANLGYELSDACTSIVAQTMDGKIYHVRNLDFGFGMGFTNSLKPLTLQIEWRKANKTVFHTTTYAGFVGALSGMKPNGFSITVDTRFYPDGPQELFYEVIAAIMEKNSSLVSFLVREVLTNENDWPAAVKYLSDTELIADVYYIVAGVSANQGAVISRNRINATDVWILNSPSRWYEVQTNYDHWEQPPWFDNRVVPAEDAMNAMGRSNMTLSNLWNVISTKPVLNLETTYTILACPADGTYTSFVRNCQYPCVD